MTLAVREEENDSHPCCSSCWCRQSDVSWAGLPARYLLCTELRPAYTPTRPCTALLYSTITHTVPVPDRKNLLVSCRTCMSLLIPPRDGHLDKVAKRIHVKIISLPGVPRPPGSKFFAESDPSLDPDPDSRFRGQNLKKNSYK
jgi:hypothetical protein